LRKNAGWKDPKRPKNAAPDAENRNDRHWSSQPNRLFRGSLGLGHSHYPVPWGALKYDTSLGGFRTSINQQQLKDAPEFSDDSWGDRSWETRTHQHYNVQQYW
jgi:hypothetical protein